MIPRRVVSEHKLVIEHKYWQPCILEFKVHTYQVIHSIKQLIFGKYSTMSGIGHRGRPKRVIPVVPSVL